MNKTFGSEDDGLKQSVKALKSHGCSGEYSRQGKGGIDTRGSRTFPRYGQEHSLQAYPRTGHTLLQAQRQVRVLREERTPEMDPHQPRLFQAGDRRESGISGRERDNIQTAREWVRLTVLSAWVLATISGC